MSRWFRRPGIRRQLGSHTFCWGSGACARAWVSLTPLPKIRIRCPAGVEFLDPVIGGVGDVEVVARLVDGDIGRA